jgi:NAD(P)H dehydrogenase (quinone)
LKGTEKDGEFLLKRFIKRKKREGEMKVLVLFHSLYGHVYELAKEIAKGVQEVPESVVEIKKVPETLSQEIIKKMGAEEAAKKMAKVPTCEVSELANYDAIFFGTPTRFGNMSGQMRQFLDATGSLWMKGALVGKIGSVFTSSATQHGGQESTILSFHITLLHHGMLVVGLPYTFSGQMLNSEITGGSPYGSSTIAGTQNERSLTENEKKAARFQGKHVATLAAKLCRK